ncbi:MAG: hypothetical protein R3249_05050 [Nitriliruptorales bacterium]|nr:hypothetical protein [Nitriliruptorales bacterium]
MRGFSMALTVVNVVYLVTGAIVALSVVSNDDPYAGLALIPWILAWPVLALAAIVWAVVAWRRPERMRESASRRLRLATAWTSIGAFLPLGLLLLYYLLVDVLPESRM